MSQSFIAFIEGGVIVLVPALLLLALGFPVLMVTWVKSVPFTVRLPWAAGAALPLTLFYVYVTWAVPAWVVLKEMKWLTLSFAAVAYLSAIGVAVAFLRRHMRRDRR